MQLHVLYIEDNEKDANLLKREIEFGNESLPVWSRIGITPISHPTALADALKAVPDVVLADLFFQPEGTVPPEKQSDHLNKIIDEVKKWDAKSPHGFPTPIIAYTARGKNALKKCLERRNELYDIWSKMAAGPEYVSWRFQKLSSELQRHRPDTTIQKMIAAMPNENCPTWHKYLLELIKSYGEGYTERDQIIKCRDSLQSILDDFDAKHSVALMTLWDVLSGSEPLLRAVAPKLRGFARHSINVFWVGYWIINHSLIRDKIINLWQQMLKSRADIPALESVEPIAGLNAIWLLASLFHDAGKFHEYGKAVVDVSVRYFDEFESLKTGIPNWVSGEVDALQNALKGVLFKISKKQDDPLVKAIEAHLANSSRSEKPDHGAVAAAYLVNIGGGADSADLFGIYTVEAARAVLLHSCLPSVLDTLPKDKFDNCPKIDWKRDPIACLLLFCDQIQTWDRQDTTIDSKDYPDRAELIYLNLDLQEGSQKLLLHGCIDYIAPSQVDMYPDLRKDIAKSLNQIILEKPKATLLHVIKEGDWPFLVHLDCALSGDKLSIDMDFV